MQDEALGPEDGEVEAGPLVEGNAEELAGHVGGLLLLLRPAGGRLSRNRAVEEDGGLPAAVLGAAKGLRAATSLRQDLAVERRSRVRVPMHQPAQRQRRNGVSWRREDAGRERKGEMREYGTTLRGAWRRVGRTPARWGGGGLLGCGSPELARQWKEIPSYTWARVNGCGLERQKQAYWVGP